MNATKKETLLLNYAIINKVCSNNELMNKLLSIYEQEKSDGVLIKKKKSKNLISRYIKSIVSTNEIVVIIGFMNMIYGSVLLTHADDTIIKTIILIGLGSLLFCTPKIIKEHDENEKISNNLKNILKNLSKNVLLTKNSQARKRIEMYKHTFSLASIEEISKCLSEEEMRVFLDNKFSYEDVNIFNQDCPVSKKMKSCEQIDEVLNRLNIKNNLLNNLYNKS